MWFLALGKVAPSIEQNRVHQIEIDHIAFECQTKCCLSLYWSLHLLDIEFIACHLSQSIKWLHCLSFRNSNVFYKSFLFCCCLDWVLLWRVGNLYRSNFWCTFVFVLQQRYIDMHKMFKVIFFVFDWLWRAFGVSTDLKPADIRCSHSVHNHLDEMNNRVESSKLIA